MKPYGHKNCQHNHPDNHPPKGLVNWWEVELKTVSKKRERRKSKIDTKGLENG